MGLNPNSSDSDGDYRDLNAIGVEGATVIETPSDTTSTGNGHSISVVPDTLSEPITADVAVSQSGDAHLPKPNTRVIIAYRPSEQPIVLGTRYTIDETVPDVAPGERVIGHPDSDGFIRFTADGTIEISGDADVVINGGNKQAITDVQASGTNAEGGITGLDITRSDSVYLP